VNCTVLQRRLLSSERPDQPAADVKSHLAQCPACRAWQRRLVHLERQIPLLPVPPSTAKVELLQRIVGPATPIDSMRPLTAERSVLRWSTLAPGPKERGLRKVSVAFALAAALLVFALGWWSWPHNPVPSSLIAKKDVEQKKLDDRLARVLHAGTPQERLFKLTDLAENIHGEARAMVDNAEKLDQWARFYSRVVSQHLLEQARELAPADRPTVLEKIADRLRRAESLAMRKATELTTTAPRSAASFDQIALAARQGEKNLRALMRG
jgi:hypothetical protein